MADIRITADITQVARLGDSFGRAAVTGLRRVLERGEQLLRREAPKVTGNLRQGVSSALIGQGSLLKGELIVSASNARRGERQAVVHYPSGREKTVTLRAQDDFNYAETVARGRGAIFPKRAKVLLIPIRDGDLLAGRTYVQIGTQKFVYAKQAKAVAANPYDERARVVLEGEAQNIFNLALDEELNK